MADIASIRQDYTLQTLEEKDVNKDPIEQFSLWWDAAVASEVDEVNAMSLGTVNADGKPAVRIVLLKDFNEDGFVFYTNYNSDKGKEMAANENVAISFFWKELQRQVRIEGVVTKVSASVSDAYFATRPRASQIGAAASPQSNIITDRSLLESNVKSFEEKYENKQVPRPENWGGYLVAPSSIEFWQGRSSRLHDRILYTKTGADWAISRLAP